MCVNVSVKAFYRVVSSDRRRPLCFPQMVKCLLFGRARWRIWDVMSGTALPAWHSAVERDRLQTSRQNVDGVTQTMESRRQTEIHVRSRRCCERRWYFLASFESRRGCLRTEWGSRPLRASDSRLLWVWGGQIPSFTHWGRSNVRIRERAAPVEPVRESSEDLINVCSVWQNLNSLHL